MFFDLENPLVGIFLMEMVDNMFKDFVCKAVYQI